MPLAFGGIGLGVLIGYPMGGAAYQTLGKTAPFIFIAIVITFNIVLQLVFLQEEDEYVHQSTIGRSYGECLGLLRDNRILLVTITICVCTSTMAILEPCVPIWLLGKMDPPPSKWQLGAIFIPDSIGYFLGCNFTGLLPAKPWRMAFCALVMSGLSCCFLPLANTISQLSLPHFCIGLGVGMADAALVPMLASLADRMGAGGDYGPIYALQQASVAVAYSLGPLLAGQAVHLIGFLWAMRIAGFIDLVMCPFMVELSYDEDLEDKKVPLKATVAPYYSST
ncbi:unnamed protein product [Acanthoscelides obtectus]|uniref:Synaptic vesicular amine transporter n=1 Tax=Acanthoscelides obtectus TaxID=200917 RepID=A0A9P0M9G7_ACAOB|nr:unnamed protein product [Acanthoscelides obtectus]CAK1658271.1 Synaptic vesicular amine transporter [Acanthoscelides obtectus]